MRQSKNSARNWNNRAVRRVIKTLIAFFLVVCLIDLLNWSIEEDGSWKPDYPREDLARIIIKPVLIDEDYRTVYLQTGLGRAAVDVLLEKQTGENRVATFEKYQENFFSPGAYDCRVNAVIVHDERLRNKDGELRKGFEIPDLRNGDILITKATHSLGWRHGHAAIVTNAAKGETMEAILIGSPSLLQSINKWRTYPSFIHLRLKNNEKASPDKIAEYAKKEILGVPYGLLTGIPGKAPEEIKKTQCAHLVWYPYEHFGIDLDSDGSWLVTPNDIANSDLLEVVQVYGVDPEKIWP